MCRQPGPWHFHALIKHEVTKCSPRRFGAQGVFEPKHKVAPEWRPLLDAARDADADAGAALQSPQADNHAPHEGPAPATGRAARAHRALMQHPATQHLRTAPRAPFLASLAAGAPAEPGNSGSSSSSSAVGEQQAEPADGQGRVMIGVRFAAVMDADLARVLPGVARFVPAEAAAADWGAALAALADADSAAAGCAPAAHAEGARSLSVSVCARELAAALDWLSRQPQVHWLEPRPAASLHNRAAGAVTQGARGGAGDPASPAAHPFWAPGVGLTGQGQTVGVGDSGLDMDSCSFLDPSVDFSKSQRQGPDGREFSSDVHRKVAYYLGRADDEMTDRAGHGTHVCGTIAGLPLGHGEPYDSSTTGVAPGARIGFIDLSAAAGAVGAPDDLGGEYFPLAYERGVRIHSGEQQGCGLAGGAGAVCTLARRRCPNAQRARVDRAVPRARENPARLCTPQL